MSLQYCRAGGALLQRASASTSCTLAGRLVIVEAGDAIFNGLPRGAEIIDIQRTSRSDIARWGSIFTAAGVSFLGVRHTTLGRASSNRVRRKQSAKMAAVPMHALLLALLCAYFALAANDQANVNCPADSRLSVPASVLRRPARASARCRDAYAYVRVRTAPNNTRARAVVHGRVRMCSVSLVIFANASHGRGRGRGSDAYAYVSAPYACARAGAGVLQLMVRKVMITDETSDNNRTRARGMQLNPYYEQVGALAYAQLRGLSRSTHRYVYVLVHHNFTQI